MVAVIILDVVVLVALIAFILFLQGSYGFDLRRLESRMQRVETRTQHLTDYLARFSEHQLDALWNRASEDIDREIVRARERSRS